ncbi:MAG TPA: flippase-like domain-containing protein [Anaerolineae bacterium]|nr:flippase-like domain-containing protein [Anaerolineae bacterium]
MFSVVVPAYNAEETIDACLVALTRQTVSADSYEVIVVDDGSRDATAAVVESHPFARLIQQPHIGASEARNRGVQSARGELVLFTDADCEPLPDWIEQLSAPFADPQVAGAKGIYCTRQLSPVARFVQAEHEEKYDRLAKRGRIDFVDTYCAAYRRDVLLARGGFDGGLPLCEDQELSYRMAESGQKLVFVPRAVVCHNHQSTALGYASRKVEIGFWKVHVHAMHPAKTLRDSYTPWTQRAQLLLLPVTAALVVAAALSLVSWLVPAIAGFAGLLSLLPLASKCVRQGWRVLALCTLLALLRALALAVGVSAGLATRIWLGTALRTTRSGRALRTAGWLVGLVLSGAAVWLSVRNQHWTDLGRTLARPDWPLLALALAAVPGTTLAKAARWQVLLRRCGTRAGLGRIIRVVFIGQLGNSFIPGRAGDVARVALMGSSAQDGPISVLGTLVVEKALDSALIILTLAGLAMWTPLPPWLRRPVLSLAAVTAALLALLIWAALWGRRSGNSAFASIGWLSPAARASLQGWLARLQAGLGLLQRPRDALLSVLWSTMIWALAAATNVLVLKALDVPAPGWSTWLVLAAGYVTNFLPAVPGQVGVFEYFAILALAAAGVAREPALAFAIVLHVLVYGPPAVLGLVSMVVEGLSWGRLKKVSSGRLEHIGPPY